MAADSFPVEIKSLYLPPLNEVAAVLESGLKGNFKDVSVNVVDCPDLTQPPWQLAAPGLSGSPCLMDIGGVPYLMPIVNKAKYTHSETSVVDDSSKYISQLIYDLPSIVKQQGYSNALVIGAGAGCWDVLKVNCEMMPNATVKDGAVLNNCTYSAKVSPTDGTAIVEKFPSLTSGPLANVLVSRGEQSPVLEIKAKTRIGEDNFVSCMRKTLSEKYGEEPVGLGGIFLITKGKAKLHVMPEFSEVPLTSNEAASNWLRYYDMSATLNCLSVFISHDPGLDLRVEHTHCFSNHGDGGHYHYDVTPNEVEYHAHYTLAEKIIRVDRPTNTHQMGRD